jgi:hypothetical protein
VCVYLFFKAHPRLYNLYMQAYLQKLFVGQNALQQAETSLRRFKDYVSQFPDVIKLTICPMGSFSTGLCLRDASSLDLIVCMDGGQLTNTLSGDQLALALSKGPTEWGDLTILEPVGDGTSLLILATKDSERKLRIFTCKPSTFPFNVLNHTQLFSSYASCDSRVPIVIALIKHWAAFSGNSRPIVNLACPLSGFHWTILILYYLVESGAVPNLHEITSEFPGVPTTVYGPRPDRDSFVCIENSKSARKILAKRASIGDDPFQLCAGFFDWLSTIDLLSVMIDLREAGKRRLIPTARKGWIVIVDPVKPGIHNTINTELGQKSQVEYAMKLRRTSLLMAERLRGSTEANFIKKMLSKNTDGIASLKVDRAVP